MQLHFVSALYVVYTIRVYIFQIKQDVVETSRKQIEINSVLIIKIKRINIITSRHKQNPARNEANERKHDLF
jgi:hypothetical protein